MTIIHTKKWLIMLALFVISTVFVTQAAFANSIELQKGDPVAGTPAGDALACRVGVRQVYDYSGVYVGSDAVESIQGTGGGASEMGVDGELVLTAARDSGGSCLYAVELQNIAVYTVAEGRPIYTDYNEQEARQLAQRYYIEREKVTGTITSIIIDRRIPAEIMQFQRDAAFIFQTTIQPKAAYTAVESDNTGQHAVAYTMEAGRNESIYTRTKDTVKDAAKNTNAANGTSQFVVGSGTLQEIHVHETVLIDQPEANDPAVSDTFEHHTLTVDVNFDAYLITTSRSVDGEIGKIAEEELASSEYNEVSFDAILTDGSVIDQDNSEQIAELLMELEKKPTDLSLLGMLTELVRNDASGVAQITKFLADQNPQGAWAQSIASVLVAVGTPEAQATIQSYFLEGKVEGELQRDVMIAASTLKAPTAEFVLAVAEIASDKGAFDQNTANLILGALVYPLADSNLDLATKLVSKLEGDLLAAEETTDVLLYLRALGNAGQDSSFYSVAQFVEDEDAVIRMTAIESLRKMPSAEVEALLQQQIAKESNRTVQMAIVSVAMERGAEDINPVSRAMMGPVMIDWSWAHTYGGNWANATLSASAYVEGEPLFIDINGRLDAEIFNNSFNVARFQLLTEKVSDTTRRFLVDLKLAGNTVYNYDQTISCVIDGSNTLFSGSIPLPGVSTNIPIWGPLTLYLSAQPFVNYSLTLSWHLDWCDVTSTDGYIQLTPNAQVGVDGYAALSLWIVRGGVGIHATLVDAQLPIRVDMVLSMTNAIFEVCLNVDLDLTGYGNIFAWYQVRKVFGGWKPRHEYSLWNWSYNISNSNLYHSCFSLSLQWTQWFDRDDPSGSGDWENRSAQSGVCSNPIAIQARVVGTQQDANATGQVFSFYNPSDGFACVNANQSGNTMCLDYEVSYLCAP